MQSLDRKFDLAMSAEAQSSVGDDDTELPALDDALEMALLAEKPAPAPRRRVTLAPPPPASVTAFAPIRQHTNDVDFDLAMLVPKKPPAPVELKHPFDVDFDVAVALAPPPPPPPPAPVRSERDELRAELAKLKLELAELKARVAPSSIDGFDVEALHELHAPRDPIPGSEQIITDGQPGEHKLTPPLDTPRKNPRRRQFDFSFGDTWGPAGATTTIKITPQCAFRVENLFATDSLGGMSTSIIQVAVGNKIQRPGNTPQGSLSLFFSSTALAGGITLDTTHEWEQIAITVSFVQACTFSAALFGTADLDL